MAKTAEMKIIAHICTEFPEKFGIPRQSGLADTRATVVFEPEFQNPDALRGLEGYSQIWLLWQFSSALRARWLPTVRPPRLGGNARMGVFATRSPFRPSPIGLSSVRLCAVELQGARGPLLHVAGADLMDGTPILDIKPYLAYTDAHPDAASGFACAPENGRLAVDFPPALLAMVPPARRAALCEVLAQDPRPAYQDAPARVYGFCFAGMEIRFSVASGRLTVKQVYPAGRTEDGNSAE